MTPIQYAFLSAVAAKPGQPSQLDGLTIGPAVRNGAEARGFVTRKLYRDSRGAWQVYALTDAGKAEMVKHDTAKALRTAKREIPGKWSTTSGAIGLIDAALASLTGVAVCQGRDGSPSADEKTAALLNDARARLELARNRLVCALDADKKAASRDYARLAADEPPTG